MYYVRGRSEIITMTRERLKLVKIGMTSFMDVLLNAWSGKSGVLSPFF